MAKKAKKIIKYTASTLVAALLVYLALKKVEWKSFADSFLNTDWWYISLSVLASVVALVFRSFRWKKMLDPVGSDSRFIKVWDANNIGNMANLAIPGAGEFVRCGYVLSEKATYNRVLGTVIAERAWDIVAIILLVAIAAVFKLNDAAILMSTIRSNAESTAAGLPMWVIAVLICVFVAIALALVYRFRDRSQLCGRIAGAINDVVTGLKSAWNMKHRWLFILDTVVIWFMYVLMSYYVFKAIPELNHLDMVDALLVSAVGNFASVIPVPGGMGAYHYLVALCLSTLYASSWATGILFATLNHEIHTLLLIVLGAISWVNLCREKKK